MKRTLSAEDFALTGVGKSKQTKTKKILTKTDRLRDSGDPLFSIICSLALRGNGDFTNLFTKGKWKETTKKVKNSTVHGTYIYIYFFAIKT